MGRPLAAVLPGLLAGVVIGIAAVDGAWLPAALSMALGGSVLAMAAVALARWHGLSSLAIGCLALVVGVGIGGMRGGSIAAASGPASVAALPGGATVRLVGIVADEPVPRGEDQDLVLTDLRRAEGMLSGSLVVRVPRAAAVTAGDEVVAEVALREPDPTNPVETAYRERLGRQGIGQLGRAYELEVIGHRSSPVGDAFGAVRRWLLDGLVRTVPEPEASLGAGILLGVRAGIDPAIRDAFAVAGLSHVVAISGWNVAIVVALIATATRRLRERLGPVIPAVVALAAVAVYVVLVGASPAVVRAALMAAALMVARLGGAPAHAGSALMAAVAMMLLVSPAALWDIGFQLSALATAGLLAFAAPVEARLERWPAWLRTPVSLTVAAQLATLPVLLAAFEQVSLVAPFANVLVVPLIPLVMAGACAAALVGGLAAALPVPILADLGAWLAGGAAWLPLHGLIVAGTAAAALPLAALPLNGGPWLAAAWYPGLAVVVRRMRRRDGSEAAPELHEPATGQGHLVLPEAAALTSAAAWLARPRRVAVGLVAAVALATVLTGPDGRLHLFVLDIGQGDAILIEAPNGATTLIDAGVDPDLTLRRIGQALGFHQRRIEVVVLTHPHQDHLGGMEEVFRRYQVAVYVDPGRPAETTPYRRVLAAAAREPGARIVTAEAGVTVSVGGGAVLEILYPSAADQDAPLPEGDVNNGSVVVLLRFGGFEALLTGDAEAPVEAMLAERNLLEPVDVLKVGHHGSDSGTTPAFLAAIRPGVAVISLGADNDYGHPHRSTLDHLAAIPGLLVYRTDLDGTVEITTDGTTSTVSLDR